ncbi:NINE protein [Gottfriedia luciferensis]|uniref:NINE protein n=1 Tax=Gottfriedia luciferensis TaxID=178774 RepID=UPI000B43C4AD
MIKNCRGFTVKSKRTAYLGIFGAHKFYFRKPGMCILYFFTLGLLFIGWPKDLARIRQDLEKANLFCESIILKIKRLLQILLL